MVIRSAGKCIFRVIRPHARRVYLVGDFNCWSRTAIAMEPIARGVWQTTLMLPPGTYRFRYFTDEGWLIDYAAFGLLPNGFGGWDSVVWVPSDPASTAPRRPVCDADAFEADLSRLSH